MIIALASPRVASSLDEGLDKIKHLLSEASAQGAAIVCFPEAYLPGLRGVGIDVLPFGPAEHARVLQVVAQWSQTYAVATVLGTERLTESGRQIVAYVFDSQGRVQGYQTKNQLDPSEDQYYVPGNTRRLFEMDGVKFGVSICHEGWRYPETVRWAAVRGAKIRLSSPAHGQRSRRRPAEGMGRCRQSLLRKGDDDAQHRECDLLRQCQLCAALSRIGNHADRPFGPVPGVFALWPGRRARASRQDRRSNRFAGQALCP
jgi:hypothetical protein